ncbi:MAG: CvpA family protein [Ruminococcaceae bacterium]|nr:CvpA family protein [Oscillospiraceae bacterium]
MSFSILSIFVIAVFALCLGIEIYRGINRGVLKTLVSFGALIVSIVLSVLIAPLLSGLFVDVAFDLFGRELLRNFSALASIAEVVIAIITSIVLFLLVFFIVRAIVALIIKKVYSAKIQKLADELDDEDHEDTWLKRNSRVVSVVVGCLSAIVLTMTITSPLLGMLDTAQNVIDFAESASPTMFSNDNMKGLKEGVGKYSNDVPGKVFYGMGGKLIFRSYACTFKDGERIALIREIEILEEATENLMTLMPVMKGEQAAEQKHLDSIDELCDCVEKMKLGRRLLATYIPQGTQAWLDGNTLLGIAKPKVNSLIDPTFNEMLRVCASSSEYNIQQNTVTLLHVYRIFLETKVLDIPEDASFDEVLAFLEQAGILDKLTEELNTNPYMSNVKKCVDDIMVDVIADQINLLEFGDAAYLGLMSNIADSINTVNSKGYKTEEEKKAVMTSLTKQYIKDYGLDVSDTAAEYTAGVILSKYGSSSEEITPEQIQDLFNSYNN